MYKKIKLSVICAVFLLLISGCGRKSELTAELEGIELTNSLPSVKITDCKRLEDADDAVYEQQIAACEMYYEAYDLTRSSDFFDEYEDSLGKDKIAYYCNSRRKDLQLDIATKLSDNIYMMVKSVKDCDNIEAYLNRVNYDAVNFYDYYADYMLTDGDDDAACAILTTFYERSNILAFRFMEENKYKFIKSAVAKITSNSRETESLNKYILMNNELIKALNIVYGGIPSEYAEPVTEANVTLVRKLLEEDNDLSEEDIDTLMYQLGEPTPTPEPTETPEPTKEPEITEEPAPVTTVPTTPAPVTRAPATAAPARPAPQPTAVPNRPTATPEVYMFGG